MNPVSFLYRCFLEDQDRRFLWIPVLMACGIALYFALWHEPAPVFLALTPAFVALWLLLRRWPEVLPLAAALLAVAIGFSVAQLETLRLSHPMLPGPLPPTSVTGTLMRAEPLPTGARLTLRHLYLKNMPRKERPYSLRIKVKTPYETLPEPGSRVNLWGPLWPPNDPVFPGGYNFRRHAFFKELGGTGISYVPPRTYETSYPPRFFWDGAAILFEKARRFLILAVYAKLDGTEKAMTAALLSGSQAGIDKNVMTAMRASGLSHLLSISGVHVSMMALLVYVPVRFVLALFPWIALRLPIKKIAAASGLLATTLYTLLVGADAPTVRSALMTGIVFFAILTDRRALSLRLLALAACLIMLIAPSTAMGPSFQMSFAAVLAMIAAYEKRADTLLRMESPVTIPSGWLNRAWRTLYDIILTSLIATAATTPFTLYHFQNFSFYGVIANIIGIPLTTLWIMPCLLLTYLTLPLGAADLFIEAAGWGVARLIDLAQTVASWPYAQIPFPSMPVWAFGLITGGGLWLCLWRQRWRYAGLIGILLGSIYPFLAQTPDLYLSDDKPVWAVRLHDGRMAVGGKQKEDFTISQWRQNSLNPDMLYLGKRPPETVSEDLHCTERHCLFTPNAPAPKVFLPLPKIEEAAYHEVCGRNDTLIIAFRPLPGCNTGLPVIDSTDLEKRGAHTITFREGKPLIRTARTGKEQRPWTPSRRQESPARSIKDKTR
ncbi:MAG: ComEC/Rec2 family competence protein [Bdellovibrionales bacterium]